MKNIKLEGKLNLNKETIRNLNVNEMDSLQGGGILSISKNCTFNQKCAEKTKVSVGKWCS